MALIPLISGHVVNPLGKTFSSKPAELLRVSDLHHLWSSNKLLLSASHLLSRGSSFGSTDSTRIRGHNSWVWTRKKKHSFIFTHKCNWNLAFSLFVNIGNKSWCINTLCDFCHPQNYRYSPILHQVVVGTGRPHFIALHFIALHRYCMFSFLQIKVLWQPWVVRWWLAFFS